ncbi:MAG: type II secretion system F family protein, partial [Isosphaeraceae bacterium]
MEKENVPPEPRDPVLLTPLVVPRRAGIRLQNLMYAVVACAVLIWLGMLARFGIILILIVGMTALGVALAVVLARRNASQQESLLWALAIASERGMPLSPAALAFAEQFGTSYRWRVQLLAALLDEGKTLPEAMSQVPGLFDREATVLIRAGWATGTLPGALRQAAARRQSDRGAWAAISARLTYVIAMVVAMQIVVGFISYFIVPKMEAIFKDFGVPLPGATRFVISASHTVATYGGVPLAVLFPLEIVALFVLPLGTFNLFQLGIPLLDRLFRRRHTALILRSLALSVQANKPIGEALAALADEYPSRWVRQRLRGASVAANHGEDWVHALLNQ